MKKLNKIYKEKRAFSSLGFPIETYLCFPKLKKAEQKGDFSRFFEHLEDGDLDNNLQERTVFLSKQQALQHERFLQKDFVVLKAYLPHTAILGQSNGLVLKKGFLTKGHVHGCYPYLMASNFYVENPHFEKKNHPPFMHVHEEADLFI